MHELSITQHLLSEVLEQAKDQKANKVSDIYITLGEFSGYVDESINFYWQQIAADTIAQNATIHITRLPGQAKCLNCKKPIKQTNLPETCPHCQSFKLLITGGDQLELTSITINN